MRKEKKYEMIKSKAYIVVCRKGEEVYRLCEMEIEDI